MGALRESIAPLAVAALVFAIFMFQQEAAEPPARSSASAFDSTRAFEMLSRILGDERPHPVDSDANDAVRARLLKEIRSLGFEPIVRDEFHCGGGHNYLGCARVRNVLFWVTEPGSDAILVASHYDSVPAGPGAADDGAGVVSSLEIARLLKDKQLCASYSCSDY